MIIKKRYQDIYHSSKTNIKNFASNKFTKRNNIVQLETKLLLYLTITAVLFSLVGIIWNLIIGLDLKSTLPVFFFFLAYSLLFYFIRLNDKDYSFVFIVLSLFALSVMYIISGGLTGSVPALYIVALITFIAISKAKNHLIILFVTILNLLLLIICEKYFQANLIVPYPSIEAKELDLGFVYLTTLLLSFVLISVFKKIVINRSDELRTSELKYQTLTNSSPVGIYHTRVDGNTTFVNQKWCEISGLAQNEALGNGWLKAVHPDDVKLLEIEWKLAVFENRKSNAEYRFLLEDGSVRWVLGQSVPETNDQDEIIGYVGTITDISEIKQFQHEQIILRKKAEESDNLKSSFLANMSHEIRTPMNSILGFSSLLKTPNLSTEKKDTFISYIQNSGEVLMKLIDDIIDISKIESSQLVINKEPVLLSEMMNELVDYYNIHQPKDKTVIIDFQILNGTENITIYTDKVRLKQLMNNLIDNAMKYGNDRIKIGFVSIAKDSIQFFIKDNGLGIPKEKFELIFERFSQLNYVPNIGGIHGVGLGLSICKLIIDNLKGEIWVESELGHGSTFYFKIPTTENL